MINREVYFESDFRSLCDQRILPNEKRIFSYGYYLLLGLIAEKVTGEKLGILLNREFFVPLKMNNTFFYRIFGRVRAILFLVMMNTSPWDRMK